MRKIIGVAVLFACLGAGALASSAMAVRNEPVWVSKEHTLKSAGETRSAVAKFSKLKIRWEDTSSTSKFEVECKQASGEVELKGGFPGTDKLTALTFEECTLTKGTTGCKLTAGGVSAEELPGWPTKLEPNTRLEAFDAAAEVGFSLVLTGCEEGRFNKSWAFKGSLKAATKNESGKVKLTLPTLAGGAEPMETEGDEASLSGTGELEEKAGTLAAEEATPRWYNGAGERLAAGVRESTVIESVGNTVIAATLDGAEVEISCPTLEGEGWVENPKSSVEYPTGGEAGENVQLARYKKCTVPKPGGTCKIAKGSFRLVMGPTGNDGRAMLVYEGTAIFDKLETSIAEASTVTIEGCEKAGLNKAWTLKGSLVGEPNNATSSITFGGTSGSELLLGGEIATFIGEDKVELETGGKIEVG
jgi:hypothetical protein